MVVEVATTEPPASHGPLFSPCRGVGVKMSAILPLLWKEVMGRVGGIASFMETGLREAELLTGVKSPAALAFEGLGLGGYPGAGGRSWERGQPRAGHSWG